MSVELIPVDRAEVVTLVDNRVDQVLMGDERIDRPGLLKGSGPGYEPLLAEHGFSVLTRLFVDGPVGLVLLDSGVSGISLANNVKVLQIDLARVKELVISHGHLDHTGGLGKLGELLSPPVRTVIHPDAFLKRYVKRPAGNMVEFPDFTPDRFPSPPFDLEVTDQPVLLAGGAMATTGTVARTTDFEIGFPPQYAERNGELTPDAAMHDDQALLFVVKDKGLVVLTGCGHSGIINTIRHAIDLTGVSRVYAVLGGFHLQPPVPDRTVEATIAELVKFEPEVIMATHCTGFESQAKIQAAMPKAFIAGTVGSTLRL